MAAVAPVREGGCVVVRRQGVGDGCELHGRGGQWFGGRHGGRGNVDDAVCRVGDGIDLGESLDCE